MTAHSSPSPSRAPDGSRLRKVLWLLARIGVTVAAFAYLLSIVELQELLNSLKRVSWTAVLTALSLFFIGIAAAAFRWRAVLAAYGAPGRPPVTRLVRLHLVGLFYNTFVPGAVGGDVVRGIAARDAFGEQGTTSSLAVVLVERVTGLCAVLMVASAAFSLHPLPGVEGVRLWGVLGVLGSVGAIAGLAMGRRSSRFLPGRLARLAASLPELRSLRPFATVITLSVFIQLLVAVSGHALVSSLTTRISLGDSLVVVPLAVAASFFPLTVAGAGAREAVFVVLFRTVGVAEADALAGSLAFVSCQMALAATGGLLNMLLPLTPDSGGEGNR